LLIKFNTRTPGKKHTFSSSDVDFETFGGLGTTLIEICYVKFKMAKPRCHAKVFFLFTWGNWKLHEKKCKPVL